MSGSAVSFKTTPYLKPWNGVPRLPASTGKDVGRIDKRPCVRSPSLHGRWLNLAQRAPSSSWHVLRRASSHDDYRPFYFNRIAYRQVRLDYIRSAGSEGHMVLVDNSAIGIFIEGKLQGLVVCIGGDVVTCLHNAIIGRVNARPFSLDLLWSMLKRFQATQGSDWQPIRVAIVDISQNTYIGRVFFGDQRTGEVKWDCDIRPSDAVYISQRCGCPIYVENSVWKEHVLTYDGLKKIMFDDIKPLPADKQKTVTAKLIIEGLDVAEMVGSRKAGVLDDDPERIKMLKRQLAIAISEEDFVLASRLRDHPAMAKYNQMRELRQRGDLYEAQLLLDELNSELVEQQKPLP